MNRLKCVFGINVSRRIPSNTTIINENRTKEICKKHCSEVHLKPLLRCVRTFSSRPRSSKINDIKSFHCTTPAKNEILNVSQRNKLKLNSTSLKRTPLERNAGTECTQRRRNSTYPLRKSLYVKRHFIPVNQKLQEVVRDVKCLKIHEMNDVDPSLDSEPRTYAQMIANYSETMCTESNSGILRDSLSTAMINGIHKSPFSTASMVSLKWKSKPKGVKSAYKFNQEVKFNSDTSVASSKCCNREKDLAFSSVEEYKHERSVSSYATMIEKYSHALDLGWNGSMIPKRNVSTNLNNFSMMMTQAKDDSVELIPSNRDKDITRELSETKQTAREMQDQVDWMAKVEDMVKDLKRITGKKEAVDQAPSENWTLQPMNEHAEWLDRVINAHKNKKLSLEKKISNLKTKSSIATVSNEHRSPPVQAASKSGTIAEYIKRGPLGSSSANVASQPPTKVAPGSAKQPQIELRMTPSQNESVVSINVDEMAAKTAGTSIKEQLSVIISSKRNKVDTSSANANTNFDSMQISISESTVPVKQIEFSINGKPVSELKSILTRANKLDVVSSMDKVEIRIPQHEQSNASHTMRADSSQVLNLQIAAKFNEPRMQQPKDTGLKTSTVVPPTTASPVPSPTPKPTPIPTPTQAPPYKPPRTQNLDSSTKNEALNTKNVKEIETKLDLPPLPKKELISTQSSLKSDDTTIQNSGTNPRSMNIGQQPTVNENSNTKISNEERVPTNTIPWWSSEECFRHIKRKGASIIHNKLVNKVEKHFDELLDLEQVLSGGIKFVNFIDFQKPQEALKSTSEIPPVENPEANTASKEKESSLGATKQTFRAVRGRGSKRLATIKRGGGVRESRKKATKVSKTLKRIRYRVKRPSRVSVVPTKESEKPTICAVQSPKIVKYVPVNPQRIIVDKIPETTVKAIGPIEQKTKVADTKKEEVNAKVAKVSEDESLPGKINVQHSNTIFKATSDSKKPANKSADISAKSAALKEQGRQDKKNLPSRRVSVEEDQKIKQIIKSMKPIEKRKDGTLIDYGVVVSSRTPSPRVIPSKPEKSPETSGKIVEPEKVFSTKKQMLTEPKIESKVNIVEPEKIISSVKKPTVPSKVEAKHDKVKLSTPEKEKQDNKPTNLTKEDNSQSQKHVVFKPIESKPNLAPVPSDKKPPLKSTSTEGMNQFSKNSLRITNAIPVSSRQKFIPSKFISPDCKESKQSLQSENKERTLRKTFLGQPSGFPPKSTSIPNNVKLTKSAESKVAQCGLTVEKQDSKNALKSESQEKTKSKGTLLAQPSKAFIKTSDSNIIDSSKSKSIDKPTFRSQSVEKTAANSSLKPGVQRKVSLEEIVQLPRSASKKTIRTDSLPLTGTNASSSSQKFVHKATKKDNSKSASETNVQSEKRAIDIKTVPLEGTINYQSVKKDDNPLSLDNDSKNKKTMSEIIKQRKQILSRKLHASKSSSGKSGNGSGPNSNGSGSTPVGPAGIPTGPAGLQPSRSFTVSQICPKVAVSCVKNESNRTEGYTISSRSKQLNDKLKLFPNEIERTEKDILYSSWLHRYKTRLNDDKVI